MQQLRQYVAAESSRSHGSHRYSEMKSTRYRMTMIFTVPRTRNVEALRTPVAAVQYCSRPIADQMEFIINRTYNPPGTDRQ